MIYFTLFLEFFKIGLFCFGGAFGMIPLIEEIVMKHNWLAESDFYNLIGVCESTPGPIAVNMATYIGSTQGGIWGSIAATLGVVLPSFIIILLIASIINNMTKNRFFQSFMKGVKPIIIALILSTGVLLLLKTFGYNALEKFSVNFISLIVFALLLGIYYFYQKIFKKKIGSITLILLSAVLGIFISVLFESMHI